MVDHVRTPFTLTANAALAQRATHLANLLGKGLPCSVVAVYIGPIVTVKFEVNSIWNLPQITMPVATYPYVRPPIQVGDFGRAYPGSTTIEPIAGLATGIPTAETEGNLSTLQFVPVSSKSWVNVQDNLDQLALYGGSTSDGSVKIADSAALNATWVLTKTSVTLKIGSGATYTWDNTGVFTASKDVAWGSTVTYASTHTHSGVTTGSGDTGPPVAGS